MSLTPVGEQKPPPQLGLWDTTSLIVGIIIGVGIFLTPGQVFAATSSAWHALLLWIAGGLLSLIGAFCFAELASTYPRSGGEYVYLSRAFGPWAGFLFAWAQLAIIRAGGSIGVVAFAFATHSFELFGHETNSVKNCALAAAAVLLLTAINILGVRSGKTTQNLLTALKVIGIGGILVAGFFFARPNTNADLRMIDGWLVRSNSEAFVVVDSQQQQSTFFLESASLISINGQKGNASKFIAVKPGAKLRVYYCDEEPGVAKKVKLFTSYYSGISLGLILVLWTYAGWHEAAYVAAEIKDKQRILPLALLLGTAIVMALYLAINLAYVAGLGFDRAGETPTVAAELMRMAFGWQGQKMMSILVVISCLAAINGMLFTSARIFVEMGEDHPLFAPMRRWSPTLGTPVIALGVQCLLTMGFVTFAGLAFKGDNGFQTLMNCTAAVFWIFFFLTGISLFVLRFKDTARHRPFRVPLYPVTPIIFCLCCVGMIYASASYDHMKTLVGLGVLLVGVPLYLISRSMQTKATAQK